VADGEWLKVNVGLDPTGTAVELWVTVGVAL
jgi:hypothetical protein